MSPIPARLLLPAMAGAMLLTACGQKGPLVLPDAGVTTPVIIRGPAEATPPTTAPTTAPSPEAEPEPAKPKPGTP